MSINNIFIILLTMTEYEWWTMTPTGLQLYYNAKVDRRFYYIHIWNVNAEFNCDTGSVFAL